MDCKQGGHLAETQAFQYRERMHEDGEGHWAIEKWPGLGLGRRAGEVCVIPACQLVVSRLGSSSFGDLELSLRSVTYQTVVSCFPLRCSLVGRAALRPCPGHIMIRVEHEPEPGFGSHL